MAKGGPRPNSGRPMLQITKLASRLIDAFPDGYEIAGRKKGIVGTSDDVQRQVVANILADEILAGRGINVVKLEVEFMARVAGKDGDTGKSSPLMEALSRCPGLLPDTDTPPKPDHTMIDITATAHIEPGTPHSECDGPGDEIKMPLFDPQLVLDLD